jgi:hypothetical protein
LDEKVEPKQGGKQGINTVDGPARAKTADELEKFRHEAHEHLQA